MAIPLDEVVHFDVITCDPTTGAAADADGTPTFEVFEEATDTDIGVGGNLTKRTGKTGNYRGTFTASSGNGFELGKWYSVVVSATVGGIAGKTVVRGFRVVAAETSAGYPEVRAVATGHGRTWYVATTGASGNDGKTWATAKALLSQAVAAASSGDTIWMGPGTFTESAGIAASAKILHIRGSGYATLVTQSADAYTLSLAEHSLVENLQLANTKNASLARAVVIGGKTRVTLRRVVCSSTYATAVDIGAGSDDLTIEDSIFSGKTGGLYASGARMFLNRVRGSASGAPAADMCGIEVLSTNGQLIDVVGTAYHQATSGAYTAIGIKMSGAFIGERIAGTGGVEFGSTASGIGLSVVAGDSSFSGGYATGSAAGSDVSIASGATLSVDGFAYDPEKVTGDGTIVDLAQSSAEAAGDAIADAVLTRSVAEIEATAPEHSLCTVVLATLESSIAGNQWTIKRTDGSATHVVKTVTSDANALPITGVT